MSEKREHKLGQYIPVHYHYQMLTDKNRMDSFQTAIKSAIQPGNRVADLGSGTGVLSFFAIKSGALVIGIENNWQLYENCKRLIDKNNMEDQIQVFHEDASRFIPDEPVDVVICEMLHSALLREQQIYVTQNFKKNHLEHFGVVPKFIPYATLLAVQPIYMDYNFNGFMAPIPLFQDPYSSIDDDILFEPMIYKTVVYEDVEDNEMKGQLMFSPKKTVTINALRFITKNILSYDVLTKDSIEWFNQYLVLPLEDEIIISVSQELLVKFYYRSGDEIEALQKSLSVSLRKKTTSNKVLS